MSSPPLRRLADYSQVVTLTQLDQALRDGRFDGVWHYTSGSNALRIEVAPVVAGIRALGWAQGAIDVPILSQVDGAWAVATARRYGYPSGSKIALDVEPVDFDANPGGWAAAAERWQADVRLNGMVPIGYGVDRTCAACFTNFDGIWRAVPNLCDPAGPGLNGAFLAGRRAIQCAIGIWAGVEMDVSFSQFSLEADMGDDEKRAYVHQLYMVYLGRLPESEDAITSWVNRIASDRSNLREIVDLFSRTAEAQAYLAVLANLRQSAGLPSSKDVALRAYLAQAPQ